jgi:putative heme-binding domain-containing protein
MLISALPVAAQQPADVTAGQRLFAANCVVCHGQEGTGGTSPVDLTRGQFKQGGSDQELFNTISNGVPGTEMPGSFLSPGEIKQVVEYVKTLARPMAGSGGEGDPAQGAALFRGKGGCLPCHRISPEGSHSEGIQLGPNLYSIGDRRTFSMLQSSILRAHNVLSQFRWKVTALTKSGQRVTGTRLNEDTHSVQLRDANNNLVSLLKANLQEFRVEQGDPLPAFQRDLSPAEVNHLAAYLATLRREALGQ